MEPQPPNPPEGFDPNKAFSGPLPPPVPGSQQASGSAGGAARSTATGGAGASVPPPPAGGYPPPGYPAYPPMMYPPPPPPKHSFVRGIFVTLATTIFGLSLMLNLYLLFLGGVVGSKGAARSTTLREGDIAEKIAVIPIKGIINDSRFESFEKQLRRAGDDGQVKAIVIEIDSPGGSVTASDQIFNLLVRFRTENPNTPVISAMNGLATSGGYYVACGTSYIVAQRTTLTGNIGVLLPRYNLSEMMRKIGVEENTIESTGSPFKNAGSMFVPDKPEERAYFQALIDDAFGQFKDVVRAGRADRLTDKVEAIANGKVYLGPEALRLGLVDQIGYLDDALDHAASAAGLTNPMAVRFEEMPSIAEMILGAEGKGGSPPGVTFHVGAEVIDELRTPRLMYLWRGQ